MSQFARTKGVARDGRITKFNIPALSRKTGVDGTSYFTPSISQLLQRYNDKTQGGSEDRILDNARDNRVG